ncbi:MAG TPA: hypothetical protein VGL72_29035 [Bryobacteraceae bacterium]
MTLKLMQSKARDLHARTRRKLFGTAAGPLAAALLYGLGIREFPSLGHWLHPLFASALAWSLAGLYFLNRGMRHAMLPGDAGLSTSLEFCREELERRQSLLRRVLLWSLGPILMALATFVLGLAMIGAKNRGLFPNGLPFLVLLVVWIAGYFVMRERELRELKREFDELNDLG